MWSIRDGALASACAACAADLSAAVTRVVRKIFTIARNGVSRFTDVKGRVFSVG
jgi:hypothetical protein